MNSYLSTFIKNHSSSLYFIRMLTGSLRMSELIAMLEATANNLKILDISPSNLQNDIDEVTAIPFPKLVYLETDLFSESKPWILLYDFFKFAQNIEVSLLSNNF
jgi:hypothetical protein